MFFCSPENFVFLIYEVLTPERRNVLTDNKLENRETIGCKMALSEILCSHFQFLFFCEMFRNEFKQKCLEKCTQYHESNGSTRSSHFRYFFFCDLFRIANNKSKLLRSHFQLLVLFQESASMLGPIVFQRIILVLSNDYRIASTVVRTTFQL